MYISTRKVCALPKENFYIDLAETDNTVSSIVLIGLKKCITDGTIQKGMKVMVNGFGVGLSWGGTMLKF